MGSPETMTTTKLNLHRLRAKVRAVLGFYLQNSSNIFRCKNHSRMPRNTLQHAVLVFKFLANHTFSNSWNLVQLCKLDVCLRHFSILDHIIRVFGFHQIRIICQIPKFRHSRCQARILDKFSLMEIILNPCTAIFLSNLR